MFSKFSSVVFFGSKTAHNSGRRNRNHRHQQRRQAVRQLILESLEDRRLLATYTWDDHDGGNWNSDSNWAGPSGYPNVADDVAILPGLTGSNRTVTVNGSYTVGTITLQADNYTLSPSGGGSLTLNGPGNAAINATGGTQSISTPLVLSDPLTVTNSSGSNLTLSGNISASLAGKSLTKAGGNTVILSGTNTYTGGTTISAGTLQISGGNAIPNASAVDLANTSEAILNVTASETIGSLSGGGASGGNVTLGNHVLTTGDASNTSYAGVLSGAGGQLTKQGGGKFTLTGSNTYTGATTVNAGTLLVNGSLTSNTTVAAGATLGGTGTISGAVTVNGTSGTPGTLSPGTSPATLTVSTLSLNSNSAYTVEIGGNTTGNYDRTTVTAVGITTIGSNVSLNLSAFGSYVPAAGDAYVIINKTNTGAVSGTFQGLIEGAAITNFLGYAGLTAYITYSAT